MGMGPAVGLDFSMCQGFPYGFGGFPLGLGVSHGSRGSLWGWAPLWRSGPAIGTFIGLTMGLGVP